MAEFDSPVGADLYAEESFYDGSDRTAALAVSIHYKNGYSYCNLWERAHGNWVRVIPEEVIEGAHGRSMLMGALMRLSSEKEDIINQSQRLSLAVIGLTGNVQSADGLIPAPTE